MRAQDTEMRKVANKAWLDAAREAQADAAAPQRSERMLDLKTAVEEMRRQRRENASQTGRVAVEVAAAPHDGKPSVLVGMPSAGPRLVDM